MSQCYRQISLSKGAQRFVFRYCDGDEASVLEAFRSLADSSSNGFDWFDAAVLAFKVARRTARKGKAAPASPAPAADEPTQAAE